MGNVHKKLCYEGMCYSLPIFITAVAINVPEANNRTKAAIMWPQTLSGTARSTITSATELSSFLTKSDVRSSRPSTLRAVDVPEGLSSNLAATSG